MTDSVFRRPPPLAALVALTLLLGAALASPAEAQVTFGPRTDFAIGLNPVYGVMQLADGRVLVAEYTEASLPSSRVLAFNADGTGQADFATGLAAPWGFTQLADGRVLVADYGYGRVLAFNADGTGQADFATELTNPSGVTQLADGRVLVAEVHANRVTAFNADGTGRADFATELEVPISIAQLSDGRVLVAEIGGRVTVFNADGTGRADFATGLGTPWGFTQLADGRVLVAEFDAGRVLAFNADGTGRIDFSTGLTNPNGVTQLTDGRVLVAEIGGRVSAFAPINAPPVANADAYTTAQDTPLAVAAPGVLANDTDPDGHPLTAVLEAGPASGTLVLNTDGGFTYTPNAGFAGQDQFTYRAFDGQVASAPATVTITVNTVGPVTYTWTGAAPGSNEWGTPGNWSPVGVPGADDHAVIGSGTVELGATRTVARLTMTGGSLFGILTDLTVTSHFAWSGGTIALNSGVLDVAGTSDIASGASVALAGGTLRISGTSAWEVGAFARTFVSLSNYARIVVPSGGALSVQTGGPSSFGFIIEGGGGRVQVDGSLTAIGPGDLVIRQTGFDFGPLASMVLEEAAVVYIEPSGLGATHAGAVSLGPESLFWLAPGIHQFRASLSGPGRFRVGASTVLEMPVPDGTGEAHAPIVSEGPVELAGTLWIVPDQDRSYPLGATFYVLQFPSRSGEFSAYEGFGLPNDRALAPSYGENGLTLTVIRLNNEPPVAENDAYTTAQDTPLAVAAPGVLANDSDPDGDPLTAVLETGPASGTLELAADGSFTYTPESGFFGQDQFTYRASDGQATSDPATVTITVTEAEPPANNPPVAENVNATTVAGSAVDIDVLAAASDPDGDPLVISAVSAPANGTAQVVATASGPRVRYTPAAGFSGQDAFTYTVSDGQATATGTVTVTVTPAPIADTTPPVCGAIVLERQGNTLVAIVSSASDPESGIASVFFTTTRNMRGHVGPDADNLTFYAQGATATFNPAVASVALRAERINMSAGGAFVVRVTNGAGLTSDCDPVVSQLSATAPEAFGLEAPYPNPARAGDAVRLAFAVAEASDVRLAVYDLTGREVARLADGAMEPGRYEVAWSGSDGASGSLAAGVYVVRMEAGAFRQTLRVTVIR